MLDIKISQELKKMCPDITLGLIQGNVCVKPSCESLLKEIDNYCDYLKEEINLNELVSDFRIKDGRESYKKLGKSPSKYRLSSEALLRRILNGKGIYKVNNIVDINNLISIKSKFPVGSYDINNISSSVILDKAKDGETYKGIGKDFINIEYLPVLYDGSGAFGSPTSDSERAMVRDCSKEIIMCIYSFSGKENIQIYLNEAKELLEMYAEGRNLEIKII